MANDAILKESSPNLIPLKLEEKFELQDKVHQLEEEAAERTAKFEDLKKRIAVEQHKSHQGLISLENHPLIREQKKLELAKLQRKMASNQSNIHLISEELGIGESPEAGFSLVSDLINSGFSTKMQIFKHNLAEEMKERQNQVSTFTTLSSKVTELQARLSELEQDYKVVCHLSHRRRSRRTTTRTGPSRGSSTA